MTRKLASMAFAAALVLTLGACSKSSDTSTTNTAAPATTAKSEKTDKTEKATKSTEDDSTETTKKSTGTTKKSSSGDNSALKSQVKNLDKSLGVDLTDEEITCLAGFLQDDPSLSNISGTPSATQASALFKAISSCIPKDKFITLVGNQLEKSGTYTASQISCIKNKLADLSAEDMAQLAAQTPEATQKFGPIFAECQSA